MAAVLLWLLAALKEDPAIGILRQQIKLTIKLGNRSIAHLSIPSETVQAYEGTRVCVEMKGGELQRCGKTEKVRFLI